MSALKLARWMTVLGAAAAAAFTSRPRLAYSSDHSDVQMASTEAAADLSDLYAFLDGTRAVFVLTALPNAPKGAKFSDVVQYVVHTSSTKTFGDPGLPFDIICTFETTQQARCWAGANEYLSGDASTKQGIKSPSGKVQIFAGVRSDPFFFNRAGFDAAVTTLTGGTRTPDVAGCATDGPVSAVAGHLSSNPVDLYKTSNVLAIVVNIDATLVTKGGPLIGSWGETYRKP